MKANTPVPVGTTMTTNAGLMKNCKNIIYAVGPIDSDYTSQVCEILLTTCIFYILSQAKSYECKSVAIPVFDFPIEKCSAIM